MHKIIMEQCNLNTTPQFSLPNDFSIRPYNKGDENSWAEIHIEVDPFTEVTKNLFFEQFGEDKELLSQRVFFLYHKSEIVGTASAWFNELYKDGTFGRVHWVALKKEFQGRGLAKPLLSFICQRFVDLGYIKAYLSTAKERVAAVCLYQAMGFREV